MKYEQFLEELNKLPVDVTEEKLSKLNKYFETLVEYNEKVNLTTITSQEDVLLKHFYDSLTPTKIYDFNQVNSLIDVGTGAGFPGVVLKIFFPNIKLTLLDSNNKKIKFLEHLTKILNLKNVEFKCERSEEYAKTNFEKYDLVIARAVKSLDILFELCLPLVTKNGYFISMKGNLDQELDENIKVIEYFGCCLKEKLNFTLPDGSNRSLILVLKNNDAKVILPREYSQIVKKPLKNRVK